jgi:glycosyltransferase involved in cell wall biosynthesis
VTTGYHKDIRIFLAISDVLVFPSYREGFPNVVMQAGAMELPSIVSNINGCNEIISENANGMIVPTKDTDALYSAMKQIILDPSNRESLENKARDQIVSRYDRRKLWEIILMEYREQQANL